MYTGSILCGKFLRGIFRDQILYVFEKCIEPVILYQTKKITKIVIVYGDCDAAGYKRFENIAKFAIPNY